MFQVVIYFCFQFPSRKNPRVAITKRVEQINNEDLEMLYVEENEKNNIPTEVSWFPINVKMHLTK